MKKNAGVLIFLAIVSVCNASATTNPTPTNRGYAYIITVGSEQTDYATITDAISVMKKNEPDENHLGLIKVQPGKYTECLGGSIYGDNTLWLPKHCDLTGTGQNIDDVIIEHPAGTPINAFTIIAAGDNRLSHLKIYCDKGPRNGIYLFAGSVLTDCIVDTIHLSVAGEENLTVSDCTIKSMYGACIEASGVFSISRCTLEPRGASSFLEVPTGILASGPGSISDVAISSIIESSYMYDGAGLTGIEIKTTANETVNISNTTITLQLTTKYNPKETAVLRVCGIMNGSRWFEPTDNYKGHTIVRDCTINVMGIEGTDSAAIMVDGICVRGGGKIDVLGKTAITTSRKADKFGEKGYEYSLNNENGTITVNADNISYDKALTNGTIHIDEDNSGEEPPSVIMDFTEEDLCYLADFNLDRIIDFRDFAVFAANWQRFGMDFDGDFDGSYLVDINDLANFAYCWQHILTDADGDGMADEWETAYGLNPLINDANQDYDGDGLTNLQEYLARTKPNNIDTDGDGYADGCSGVVSISNYPVGTDNDNDGFVDGEATVCSNPLVYDPVEPPYVFEHSYCVKVHSSCTGASMADLFSTASYKLRRIDGNDDFAFYATLSIYSINNSWNVPPYDGYLSSYSDFLAVEEYLLPSERARGAVVLFDSSCYDCPGATTGVIFLFKNFSIRVGDAPDQSTLVHEIGHVVWCDHQGSEYFYMTPSDVCQNYKARCRVNQTERNKFCPYHQ